MALWADRLACSRMLDVYVNVNQANPMTPIAGKTLNRESSDSRQQWSISDLAAELQVTPRTLRFYEAEGLIEPIRGAGGSRTYTRRDRARMQLILRGKRLGLSLAEIGELLDLYEVARNERAQLSKFVALLVERRGRLLQQKEDIDATLAEIEGLERECRRRLKDQEARARRDPATPAAG